MNVMTEQDIQEWFDRIDAYPGVFDGLREIGEGGSISPRERVHELFLKRLYGQKVALYGMETTDFGEVVIDDHDYIDFDFIALERAAFQTRHRFESENGVSGEARIDWRGMFILLVPDTRTNENVECYHYTIGLLQLVATSRLSDGRIAFSFSVGLAYRDHNETVSEDIILENTALSKLYIECGVFNQGSKAGFLPSRTPSLKEISEITGVTASTLSNLKNKKRQIENLTYDTFAILSQFGYLRHLDDSIYAQFTAERNREKYADVKPEGSIKATFHRSPLSEEKAYRLAVVMTDGTIYYKVTPTYDYAELRLHEMNDAMGGGHTTMILENSYMETVDGFTTLKLSVIPVNQIKRIHIETYDDSVKFIDLKSDQ